MAAKKPTRKVLSRNSYRGRIMGTLPAFEPGRCTELTPSEQLHVQKVRNALNALLSLMEKR